MKTNVMRLILITILFCGILPGCAKTPHHHFKSSQEIVQALFADSTDHPQSQKLREFREQSTIARDLKPILRELGMSVDQSGFVNQKIAIRQDDDDSLAAALGTMPVLTSDNPTEITFTSLEIIPEDIVENEPAKANNQPEFKSDATFKERYDAALRLFLARQYLAALQAFSKLAVESEKDEWTDNCLYWLGEAQFGIRNYDAALAEFEKVFNFRNSNKVEAAMLKMGIIHSILGNDELAKLCFDLVLAKYPQSDSAPKARLYLQQL